MAKVDLPQDAVTLQKSQRYEELYYKPNKTSAEITEMASLQADLANSLITASEWNTLQQQVTDGFNGVSTTVNNAITTHKAESDPHPQYALLASPHLTGAPTAPTPTVGDNSTRIATMAALQSAVAAGAKIESGSYSGNGTNNRTISLPFTPKIVFVYGLFMTNATVGSKTTASVTSTGVYLAEGSNGGIKRDGVTTVANGFLVAPGAPSPYAINMILNVSGESYEYFALG